jgi:hypothetical protein
VIIKSDMETKCSTGKLRRRLLRVCGAPERSAVVTLARREAGARSVVAVNRRRLPLSRVLRRGDGAAVLGFSLDGDYLRTTHAWADMLAVRLTDLRICVSVFAGWWEAGVDIHWRRADFLQSSDPDDDAQQLAVYSMRVGDWRRSDTLPLGNPVLSGASACVSSCR